MNKGHIQAERAEAIHKAMNAGTQENVENVNKTRQQVEDEQFRPVTRYVLTDANGRRLSHCEDTGRTWVGDGWNGYTFDSATEAFSFFGKHCKDTGALTCAPVFIFIRECDPVS